MPLSLRDQLTRLKPPVKATYAIVEVGTSPRAFAAIDGRGRPALLVETSSAVSRDVARRGLRLQHRATCHVEIDGTAQTIVASLVACEADDPPLQAAFVSVGEIVLSRLSGAKEAEVVSILEELVELLERAGEPSREGAIGLFAELLVLSLARDPKAAVRAWRTSETDRFDLVHGTGRIEVKASGTRERRHRFSLEQCASEAETHAFVASTLVLESSGGRGVRELASEVKDLVRADADLTMKVEHAVTKIMGLPRTGEPIFDDHHARSALKWYDMADVPAIRSAPALVDQVRFRSDLAEVRPLTIREVEACEPCLSPCLPAD